MYRLPLVALALFSSAGLAGDNWPGFLAGDRSLPDLPDRWGKKENVAWSAEVPGRGWSSPVVWGDRVFVTTVASETPAGNPKKGLYIEDLQGKTPPGEHRWLLCCYDWKTGKRLWQKEAHKGKAPGTVHVKNSYASETPAADAERVYAYFGNVGVFCYTHDGEPVWSKTFEAKRTRFGWGPAASPALHRDTLFVVNDNEEASSLLALDAKTGRQRWSVSRDEKSNWATP